jgi:hypothetical protein
MRWRADPESRIEREKNLLPEAFRELPKARVNSIRTE